MSALESCKRQNTSGKQTPDQNKRKEASAEEEEEASVILGDGLDYLIHEYDNKRIIGQIHPTKHIQFGQIGTFLRLPRLHDICPTLVPRDDIDIITFGIPFDNGCSFKSGARFGPHSIRESSRIIEYPFEKIQVADGGDLTVTPFNIDIAMKQIYNGITDKYLTQFKNVKLAIMGGDHTLSFPTLHALYNYHNKKKQICLIHFDAHLDTYNKTMGQDVWHGSPFRKAFELGLIDTKHSMHVGVRQHCGNEHEFAESKRMGYHCITTEEIHSNGVKWTIDQITHRLGITDATVDSDKVLTGDDLPFVYLSVDIDVLDPSVAPGTGTPECGGLFASQLFAIFRAMKQYANKMNIIGCDVVEVSPAWDTHANITGLAGAHTLFQMMQLMETNIVTLNKQNGKNGNGNNKNKVVHTRDVRAKL